MITVFGKNVPTELLEIVDPMSTAVLVIDMQNDCCARGGSAHDAGGDMSMYEEIIPRIASFADVCRSVGVPVIHVGLYTLPDGRATRLPGSACACAPTVTTTRRIRVSGTS